MKANNPIRLNGVKVYPFASADELIHFADTHKGILVAINAEKIIRATDETRQIINRNIGYCDGIGAVYALKRKGYPEVNKIPGCELWLEIIRKFSKEKSFYLVGGRHEVITDTTERLKQEFPGIHIVGFRDGYLKNEEEEEQLIRDIEDKKPDVVFVAMGSPRQELLMERMLARHPAIYQGLGGSFDVYTGQVERAPEWWLKHNLEFAYRLLSQPGRIKRQIHLLPYAFKLLTNQL